MQYMLVINPYKSNEPKNIDRTAKLSTPPIRPSHLCKNFKLMRTIISDIRSPRFKRDSRLIWNSCTLFEWVPLPLREMSLYNPLQLLVLVQNVFHVYHYAICITTYGAAEPFFVPGSTVLPLKANEHQILKTSWTSNWVASMYSTVLHRMKRALLN